MVTSEKDFISVEKSRVSEWSDIYDRNPRLGNDTDFDSLPDDSTLPIFQENGIAGYPQINFVQREIPQSSDIGSSDKDEGYRSALRTTNYNFASNPFTFFVVAKSSPSLGGVSEQILLSQASSYEYLGFGVKDGAPYLYSSDTTSVISPIDDIIKGKGVGIERVEAESIDTSWHVYCFSSKDGIDGGEINVSAYDNGTRSKLHLKGIPNLSTYCVVGGGSKHHVDRPWGGSMVEIVFYRTTSISEEEILKITNFLMLKYGIE